ncbi:Up-regulated during septation-domain-containing protein [Fusarium avenaceum]|nr:Up-regulated during septation-domain-containing protein [Fusarium avenaceum]
MAFFQKLSPQPPSEKPFAWRMQQPDPTKKYQLFPKERKLPVLNSSKGVDSDKTTAGTSTMATDNTDSQPTLNGLKKRFNQHSLTRRRKISVPEVGPMTTVQELSMDSPTIPGRPPFHERSISAPGNSLRDYNLTDTFLFASSDDEGPSPQAPKKSANEAGSRVATPTSPRHLAPLVIPRRGAHSPLLRRQQSLNCFPTVSETSRRGRGNGLSPQSRSAITPTSSMPDLTIPSSASTGSTTPTPVSAPPLETRTESPQLVDGYSTPPLAVPDAARGGHRRGGSESSVMDRGRPRKRHDQRSNTGPIIQRAESKRSRSSEQNAFEKLPVGVKHSDAMEQLELSELILLQKQAYEQVGRFEILKAEDVEALSKELRHLDQKTEYLRRTYTALRSGRKNLHSRICQYLRSPRVAKFSNESMLKQEEALTELDASIDDWVNKLEQAENRRTRVRQKLLEHVAAAVCLPIGGSNMTQESPLNVTSSSGICDISTPPRSPSKETCVSPRTMSSSPSPHRVVAQVPSTILEQPAIEEEAMRVKDERVMSSGSLNQSDGESIRIYAGDDVYTLLADVEDEITRMGKPAAQEPAPRNNVMETKRIALNRQRSHELLNGRSGDNHGMKRRDFSDYRAISPLASPPTTTTSPSTQQTIPPEEGLPLLANVVYRP